MFKYLIVLIVLFTFSLSAQPIMTGADVLISEKLTFLSGKKIGIVTNHTALLSDGNHLVDALVSKSDFKITALFGPEHGIRGNVQAGETVNSGFDVKTGVKVHSLYGNTKKPTREMLSNVDLLIFDIQDVGARFYTYISTLFYVIESANENNIPLIVLDRPNPIGGFAIDGPIRKEGLESFVGIAPIPVIHSMTVGELANYFIGEGLIKVKQGFSLEILRIKNWNRNSLVTDYNSDWIPPSPNLPFKESAIVYPGTCLIEGTNVSEGRGTLNPFLTIGAPFINSQELINELSVLGHPGLLLSATAFIPMDIDGMSSNPKYKNIRCNGIQISVKSPKDVKPFEFGLNLICALQKLYPDNFQIKDKSFDLLIGDKNIRRLIKSGSTPYQILNSYFRELNHFQLIRQKYLLY